VDNTDCDDSRSTSYPNATETPDNNIDEDCSIFTAMGHLVKRFNLAFLYNEATFNVGTLPSGVYFLRFSDLETGDKLFVEKLIIYK